ncbi:hypothetical protein CK220_20430 [Mesorhizobium sp. WSM3860]|nr:hypothetical protein CK220_20430 [Mesorhizobium sp. WSM3860]
MRDEWEVTFTLAPVMINLDRYHKLTGSISIAFFAWAKTHQDALSSRERLIAILDEGLSDETVRSAFEMH